MHARVIIKTLCFLDLEATFRNNMFDLFDFLMKNLVFKKINGKQITCGELCDYLEDCYKEDIFDGNWERLIKVNCT